jgi:hypothetical protein
LYDPETKHTLDVTDSAVLTELDKENTIIVRRIGSRDLGPFS